MNRPPARTGLPDADPLIAAQDTQPPAAADAVHDLHGISLGCNAGEVDIDWPADFGRWLDRHEEEARSGDQRSRLILAFTARALDQLRHLTDPPTGEEETATLRRVRQSRRYQLWRVSHAYHPQVAVRGDLLVPTRDRHRRRRAAADEAKLGDVFYDGVAARADPMIDQWKRETSYEEKS